MNDNYHLVVFDWEGTLGDTLGKLIEHLKSQSQRMNLNTVNEQTARQYLLMGLNVALKKIFPNISPDQEEIIAQSLIQCHASKSAEVYLIPGAREILKAIHTAGQDIAIATNKSHQSLHRDLQNAELEQFITVTRAAGQVPAKPCPQMLEEIMSFCGVTEKQTLVIGDSVSDIAMAKALQVKSFGVSFYNQPEATESLLAEGAEQVFEDYHQLAKALNLKL